MLAYRSLYMATPQKRLHRVTIRNHSRWLACRGGPDRRSKWVSLKHDGTDGTVNMASLPVPSLSSRWDTQAGPLKWPVCLSRQPRSSANLAGEVQTLLSRLSDPAEDFVQAVHCALHRSPCVILYTKQQIKKLLRTSTQELYFECVI